MSQLKDLPPPPKPGVLNTGRQDRQTLQAPN